MREFFGLDMQVTATVLAVLLIVSVLFVVGLGLRNRILVKLALRNIPRRPAQTVLIVFGLMLSTTIIAASLAIGDTVAGSIRGTVLDALGETDIRVRSAVDPSNIVVDDYLDAETQQAVLDVTAGDSRIDGVLPQVRETLPVLNNRTQLTEARMNVVGLDPDRTSGFGDITSTSGESITVASLANGEALINETAADEIDAAQGDQITLVTPTGRHDFTLRAVMRDGGLAANDSRLILSLSEMQRIMDREGQVNRIDISLTSGRGGDADLSEAVAEDLRVEFTDEAVAGQLFDVLNDPEVIAAIESRIEENPGDTIRSGTEDDLNELIGLLKDGERDSDQFRALVANAQVSGQIVAAVESAGLGDLVIPLTFLFISVEILGVDELKQDGLELAEFIGNIFVTFFSIFGSFSIIVGLLLIFLVFVLLAAERSAEMGIARAVGTKRRHLVQMFTFEGVAYSIGAAIVGTIIGLAASRGLVALLASAIGAGDGDSGFDFTFSITATSVIAGFSLGLLLTLVTVGISAYRVSKLNIVVAIRGLPAELVPTEVLPFWQRLQNVGKALIYPLWQLYVIARGERPRRVLWLEILTFIPYVVLSPWVLILMRRSWSQYRGNLLRFAVCFIPVLEPGGTLVFLVPTGILLFFIWKFISPWFGNGIPQILIGLVGILGAIIAEGGPFNTAFVFTMLTSLFLVGIGQFVRWITYRNGLRREVSDRLGFTLMGVLVLVFWALPFSALEGLTGELGGGIEMFILSGVWMVASAVWIVMYNADLITNLVQATLGRNRTLRPILKPAIAYPTSSRFRTGLTVAMFALVIFTMMVFSILNNLGSDIINMPGKATGGFDVRAETSADLPIDDINAGITAAPNLNSSDFVLIAASTDLPAEARQTDAEEIRFLETAVRGVDDNYLRNVEFELSHYDPSFLPAGVDTQDDQAVARAIWDRLAEDPTLAVVTNSLLEIPEGGGGFNFGPSGFQVEGIAQDDDEEIEAVEVSVRQSRGQGDTVQRTIIGAMDAFAGAFESDDGSVAGAIVTSSAVFDEIAEEPVPFTTYRLKLAPGVDAGRTAAAMETAFLDNSLLATDTIKEIEDSNAQNDAFNRLFQSFMGLGLIVGVASLGVLSFRAVVERRVSIGMMRAIGYKSQMIQIQFLIESVFVTVLGTALGLGLGALISWNIVNDIQESFDGLTYSIPWATVSVIVIIAIVAALLTTLVPARQASRIFPSEALRYE